jgi:hypothetical protein
MTTARSALATSPDGQWVAVRRGHEISLLAGGIAPATGKVDIGTDDADVLLVGPPTMCAVVVRNVAPRVMLYQLPNLDVVARHDLDVPMRVAAITGPRIALVSPDNKKLVIVRVAQNALSAQAIDLDGPLDFAVGLEKGQLLLSIQRKLEVWDAATGRPMLRMQLQLPPPPRTVGAAQGHVWVTRPSADDVIVYRLSDGRPFRHTVGAPAVEVVSSPASPILVVGTVRHLVRVHCFAHSITVPTRARSSQSRSTTRRPSPSCGFVRCARSKKPSALGPRSRHQRRPPSRRRRRRSWAAAPVPCRRFRQRRCITRAPQPLATGAKRSLRSAASSRRATRPSCPRRSTTASLRSSPIACCCHRRRSAH